MTWQTLRDYIDTRWAAAVTGYTGAVQTALKAGPVTAIAQGIDDEGLLAAGFTNTYSEDYALTASQTVLANLQACGEDTYGDPWWWYRPTTLHTSLGTDAAGVWTMIFQAAGNEDTYDGTFSGPAIARNTGRAHGLIRGQAIVYRATVGVSNPTDYNLATEWARPGIYLTGHVPTATTRQWVAALLRAQAANRKIQLVYTLNGTTSTIVDVDIAGDDTWFTGGTELELSVDCFGEASMRYRKAGAGAWIDGGTSQVLRDFSPTTVYYGCGHGVCNNASTVTISDLHEEVS